MTWNYGNMDTDALTAQVQNYTTGSQRDGFSAPQNA